MDIKFRDVWCQSRIFTAQKNVAYFFQSDWRVSWLLFDAKIGSPCWERSVSCSSHQKPGAWHQGESNLTPYSKSQLATDKLISSTSPCTTSDLNQSGCKYFFVFFPNHAKCISKIGVNRWQFWTLEPCFGFPYKIGKATCICRVQASSTTQCQLD